MAKYFLGSVGSAEAFRMVDGQPKMAFVAKTLTDSSISVTITKDELRGGTGAPVVTNFFHDPAVAITLTDILFKESYIEAQLGTEFKGGNVSAYYTEKEPLVVQNGKITLTKTPVALDMLKCDSGSTVLVWYAKEGTDEYTVQALSAPTKEVTIAGATNGDKYCVRYLADNILAREAVVKSDMVPKELMLVITVPIFAGDACAASKASKAGTLTFEVPRFQLDGGQEFTFNMSSNATMSLNGTALVMNEGCDANSGKLFRIIEVMDDNSVIKEIKMIAIDPESAKIGNKQSDLAVYALYKDKTLALLSSDDMTLEVSNTNQQSGHTGEFIAGTVIKATLKANTKLKDSYTVPAATV